MATAPGRRRGNPLRIVSDQGTSVIDVEQMDKAGDRLRMKGTLVGQFETQVYVGPADFYRMFRLLLFGPSALGFVLLSPLLWVKNYRKEYAGSATTTRITIAVSVTALILLVLVFLIAMMALGIYTLVDFSS